jgi:2,3-bisphosphoglycerate-dependent phosphoglycerate mutase
MTVQQLWLIRHGESTANIAAAEAEASGHEEIAVDHRDADVPLSALGRRQAQALAGELVSRGGADVDDDACVLVSPYRRARETAALAGLHAGVDRRAIDERLRDRELGVLDRLTRKGVRARYPDEEERRRWLGKYYHRPAGGESWADVMLRLRSLFRDLGTDRTPERLVLVTHDAVVTLVIALCLGWDEEQLLDFAKDHVVLNASITTLHRDGSHAPWSLDEFSTVGHLADEDVTEHRGERESTAADRGRAPGGVPR